MAELLVTGGTGVLGREAVPALRAAGHQVRVLSREPGDGHVVGDLSDPAAGASVDCADVAAHLVELVAAGPAGGVREFGGPEVRDAADLARSYLAVRGGGRVLTLPVPGAFSRAVRAGGMLPAPDAPRGTVTWEQWLARTGGEQPYEV